MSLVTEIFVVRSEKILKKKMSIDRIHILRKYQSRIRKRSITVLYTWNLPHTFYEDLFILSRISVLWKFSEPFKKELGKNGNALAVL